MIKNKKNKKNNGLIFTIFITSFILIFSIIFALTTSAQTDTTRPTILSVSPMNNEADIELDDVITVTFSEMMDYKTINETTFIVYQRTTPGVDSPSSEYRSIQREGIVTYEGDTATFSAKPNEIQPNQIYGNVFTVIITTGAKDLSGNSLSRDYMWSFTTGPSQFNTDFNTGASTSQLDQSIVSNSEQETENQEESTLAPFVGNEQQTQNTQQLQNPQQSSNSSFWFWLILGALILLVAVVIFSLLAYQPKRRKVIVTNKTTSNKPNPFGDIHPINNLEGIGPTYKKALNSIGISDTKQLWLANTFNVSKQIGVSAIIVKSWQNMAELASVKDIGPQYAELLERSGVHNIEQLKSYNVKNLLNLIQKKQASLKINIQGNVPGKALVENWIDQAKHHNFAQT